MCDEYRGLSSNTLKCGVKHPGMCEIQTFGNVYGMQLFGSMSPMLREESMTMGLGGTGSVSRQT